MKYYVLFVSFLLLVCGNFFLHRKIRKRIYKKNEEIKELQAKVLSLSYELIEIRKKFMVYSPVRKALIRKIALDKNFAKILVDDNSWLKIENEIDLLYPDFEKKLSNSFPDLNSSDIQYCYLSMMEFDTNQEATLLGITPGSVSKRRTRIREKLHVDLTHSNLTHFLEDFYNK